MEHTSLETNSDLPSFVPEKELKTAVIAAHQVAQQRDQLASENARLRRDLESSSRSQRELEETTRGGDGLSKRLRLLREALVRKDQEILNLKTSYSGHTKQLREAQETADRLRRERADLEERLRTREGAFASIQRERENLSHALDGARREGERAAQVVVQADTAVHEWRAALEATARELEEARRQIGELRAAWQTLAYERQRLVEAHVNEVVTARADAAAVHDALRNEMEQRQAEAEARFDAAREAHAIALRAAEDELATDLAEERQARERLEVALANAQAHIAEIADARDWIDGELNAVRARLEAAEAGHETHIRDLHEAQAIQQDAHARELEALADGHQAELKSVTEAFEAELRVLRGVIGADTHKPMPREMRELGESFAEAEARARSLAAEVEEIRAQLARSEAALAEAVREREEAQCAVVEILAETDARHASLLRDSNERHEDATRESSERYRAQLDEARRYFNEALEAQRESHESEVGMLQDSLSGDEARVRDLERDLETAREALGNYAAESAARMIAAERAADEAEAARDRYARKLAAAQQRLQAASTGQSRELCQQVSALTRMVGEVMATAVVQICDVVAARAGRDIPEMTDVEEAISLVSDGLPEDASDMLWDAKDSLIARVRDARGAIMA